ARTTVGGEFPALALSIGEVGGDPSGAWQKYSITLYRQWTALIRPLERFGHRLIEVGNEGQDALPQVRNRREVPPLQQPAYQNAEPELDLVQPTAVLRCIEKADAMAGITQERCAGRHRLQDPPFLLLTQLLRDATYAGDQPHQG